MFWKTRHTVPKYSIDLEHVGSTRSSKRNTPTVFLVQGSTLTHDRPTLSACCSVRSGWTHQIQARLVILISCQHSSFINSFVYDCKLTFSLVERMIVLEDCLLFYHIRYGCACVTSPGNPAWVVPVFSLSLHWKQESLILGSQLLHECRYTKMRPKNTNFLLLQKT